jgi:mRNA-degrading endonuclease RelE of RelBE toxin-antitoxin system
LWKEKEIWNLQTLETRIFQSTIWAIILIQSRWKIQRKQIMFPQWWRVHVNHVRLHYTSKTKTKSVTFIFHRNSTNSEKQPDKASSATSS